MKNRRQDKKEKDKCRAEGVVVEALGDLRFRVKLDDGREIIAYLAGKLRIRHIQIMLADRVVLQLDPYGGNTSRIIYRPYPNKT